LDKGKESFVGFHNLPVRHAMTIGEIAQMLKSELKLDVELEVVACQGWRRGDQWGQTGLMWVNPSPNMRSFTQALLYPGIGLLETTNVSVGRGTDTPFEVLGAPWIEARQLASQLNTRNVPGTTFVPIEFTPEASKFANEACQGINIVITDHATFEPVRVGMSIAVELHRLYPADWETKSLNRLLGNDRVFEDIVSGKSIDTVMESAGFGLRDFRSRRARYLLYK
jgi:uncharacterized protein YbbC (DUF1343 family)